MTTIDTSADIVRWDIPAGVGLRGTLIVIPGRGEHPGLYERFGRRISSDAYVVQVVASPTESEAQTRDQISTILADSPATPVVLVGSDAGALYAAGLVAQGEVEVQAVILSGLPVRDAVTATHSWDDEIAVRTACSAHAGRLRADGRVRHGALDDAVPTAWFDRAQLSQIAVPVLALHGADDEISPLAVARSAYSELAAVELLSIDGGRHDALNDQTHRTAAASIVLFLERLRLAQPAPTAAPPALIARAEAI